MFRRKKKTTEIKKPDSRFTSSLDRRLAANFDWFMFAMIVLMILIGLVNLYSATRTGAHADAFNTQLRWSIIGIVFLVVAFVINYRLYDAIAYWIYATMIILLMAVLLFGPTINNANRWLSFGGISFQPSELAKVGLVMALAKYLAANKVPHGYNIRELLIPAAIIAGPSLLVLMEPDLGTALVMILISGSMLLFNGVRKRTLIGLFALAASFAPIAWFYVLKEYQKNRILTLLDPNRDPQGTGYHIKQSLIAIGSGKFFGKGYLNGTQNKLSFLPEHHTDFVFSVFAEEWGFIGCLILLLLYFAIIVWSMTISMHSKDRFAAFMAVGLSAIIFWHVFINIGMVIGIMPVVGMPLPFMSYGRSSLMTMMIVVGLLLNISSRRYMF